MPGTACVRPRLPATVRSRQLRKSEAMGTEDKRRLVPTRQVPGADAFRRCLASGCLVLAFLGAGTAPVLSGPATPSKLSLPAHRDLLVIVQGVASPLLPSLVLPPDATAGPPMFATLMRQGDSAMLHGNVSQARSFYERAAMVHREASVAPLAVGKTFDPNILAALGVNSSFANPVVARAWYERARALGDAAAAELLARLP